MISKHHDESVTDIHCKTGKHPAHLGTQRSKGFQDKRVWEFRLGKTRHLDNDAQYQSSLAMFNP